MTQAESKRAAGSLRRLFAVGQCVLRHGPAGLLRM